MNQHQINQSNQALWPKKRTNVRWYSNEHIFSKLGNVCCLQFACRPSEPTAGGRKIKVNPKSPKISWPEFKLQPDQPRQFFSSSLADAINLPETSEKAPPNPAHAPPPGQTGRQISRSSPPSTSDDRRHRIKTASILLPAPSTRAEVPIHSAAPRGFAPPIRCQISRGGKRIWGFSRGGVGGGDGRGTRRWRSRGCGGSRSSSATYATATTRSRSASVSTRSWATSARGSKMRRSRLFPSLFLEFLVWCWLLAANAFA